MDRPAADFLTVYPAATPGADLDLDIAVITIGYFTTTAVSPYQPLVEMKYRLVRAGSGDVLAQGAFHFSILGGAEHPDTKYNYGHYSAFAANPSIAVAGLSDGLNQAAGVIATAMH